MKDSIRWIRGVAMALAMVLGMQVGAGFPDGTVIWADEAGVAEGGTRETAPDPIPGELPDKSLQRRAAAVKNDGSAIPGKAWNGLSEAKAPAEMKRLSDLIREQTEKAESEQQLLGAAEPMFYHSMPAVVIDVPVIWDQAEVDYLNLDLWIAPEGLLLIQGDVWLDGDLYNYGGVILDGNFEADFIYTTRMIDAELWELPGDFGLVGLSDVYSYPLMALTDIPLFPYEVASDLQVDVNQRMENFGVGTLTLFEMAIDNEPVVMAADGSVYYYNYFVGDKTEIKLTLTDPLGQVYSYVIPLTKKIVTGIVIDQTPLKTRYQLGESLDPAGIGIRACYSDGTSDGVRPGYYTITGYDSSVLVYGQILTVSVEAFTATFTVDIVPKANVQVFAGTTRFDTARLISQAMYESADTAILVKADNFPDALAAGPLAYALNAPILLTPTGSLDPVTRQELIRLGVKDIIIMGGNLVVSQAVEEELKQTWQVRRIAGANRYDTALLAARELIKYRGIPEQVIIASGVSFPDALVAGSYAAKNGYPMLLTDGKSLTADTMNFIRSSDIKNAYLMGGPLVISNAVADQLLGYHWERLGGVDRIHTSTIMARQFFLDSEYAFVANGWTFPDALAAAPYAARLDAPVLLIRKDAIDPGVKEYFFYAEVHTAFVAGGEFVVSAKARDELLATLQEN